MQAQTISSAENIQGLVDSTRGFLIRGRVLVLNPMHKTFNVFPKTARLHLLFNLFGGGVVPTNPRPSRVSATEVTFSLVVALTGCKLWFLTIIYFFDLDRAVSKFRPLVLFHDCELNGYTCKLF